MKLVNGQWQKIPWDQAINEIGDKMLQIREESGPDSVYWLGSAKFNNEQAYLFRKFAGYWGTNNVDHQARICHSTTVAGVANTWGYGAMTNSYNDIHKSKAIFIIGGNPAGSSPGVAVARTEGEGRKQCSADRLRSALQPAQQPMPTSLCVSVRAQTLHWCGVFSGTSSRTAGKTKSSSVPRVYGMEDIREEVKALEPRRSGACYRCAWRTA